MRRLLERFYSYSLLKRTILLVFVILAISATMTVYSFYNMASAAKLLMGNDAPPFKSMKIEQLKERVKSAFVPDHVTDALDALSYLQDLAEKLHIKTANRNESNFDFSRLNQQKESELRQKIEVFNYIKWEELHLFATSQVDPFSPEPELINLRKISNASRLLSEYFEHFKQTNKEESAKFIFSAIHKIGAFTDISSPFLIGKMVSVAINGIAVKPFKRYVKGDNKAVLPKESILDLNLISPAEAAELKSVILTSLKLEIPFQRFLESEYVFFKKFSAKIYEKAPLAAHILTLIFGNPDSEYKKIVNHPADKKMFMKTMHGWKHPLLIIAVPNFTKAFQIFNERQAQRAVLAAELAHLAGETTTIPDPFSNNKIMSLDADEKLKFYSVGPNGIDDKMTNDDISLYNSTNN